MLRWRHLKYNTCEKYVSCFMRYNLVIDRPTDSGVLVYGSIFTLYYGTSKVQMYSLQKVNLNIKRSLSIVSKYDCVHYLLFWLHTWLSLRKISRSHQIKSVLIESVSPWHFHVDNVYRRLQLQAINKTSLIIR